MENKTKKKKRKPFIHLNQFERDRLEILLKAKVKQKDIAVVLKVNPSTISREKKRKRKNGYYDAETAEHKASIKRSNASYKGRKIEESNRLKEHIVTELKQKRSPDEISGRMKKESMPFYVGKDAIYAWLYSSFGQQYCKYLCTKQYRRRKQKRKTRREMIPNRVSLKQRPVLGEHIEGDLFVSPSKLGTSASGALFCVESTQLLVGMMVPDKRPSSFVVAVHTKVLTLGVDDLTLDNGIENRNHQQFGISTYFADPHAPWQKPHVENNIGLLRRWFVPKNTDLRTLPDEVFQNHLNVLNHKYRKSLGYMSAYEVSLARDIIQEIPPRTIYPDENTVE